MHYSGGGKYRGTSGTLIVGNGVVTFTRVDGIITKKERIVISIPTVAIRTINVEGMIKKKLVLLVDNTKVPGVPRHEFEVPDAYRWMNAIQDEMVHTTAQPPQQFQAQRETYVKEITREIIKIPCRYCGCLNEITEKSCTGCGASVGGR